MAAQKNRQTSVRAPNDQKISRPLTDQHQQNNITPGPISTNKFGQSASSAQPVNITTNIFQINVTTGGNINNNSNNTTNSTAVTNTGGNTNKY